MFNLNINWHKIIKENIPFFLQTTRRIDWIKALISPFNQIYSDFLVMYKVYVYKIRYNGQIIYLEKILNDKFSPLSGGIYIIDGGLVNRNFLYRKSESKPPFYVHRKWKSTLNYVVDNYTIDNNKIYRCIVNNTNFRPSLNPTKWVYVRDVVYLRRRNEFYIDYDFIVKIPSTITFNLISLKAIVDYYRLASKRYKIEIY